MARARSSLPTPSVVPSLPEASLQSSTSRDPDPQFPQFLSDLHTCLNNLSPTDLARLGGPGLYDLGFPDPLGFLNMEVETLGLKLHEHILDNGGVLRVRYQWIAAELFAHSVLHAPQHCLTILLRMAVVELFVQRCALVWGPADSTHA